MFKIICVVGLMAMSGVASASSVVLHEQNTTRIFEISRVAVTPFGVQLFATGNKLACLIDSNFLKATGASAYEVMKDLMDRTDRSVECSEGVAKEIKTVSAKYVARTH